MGDRWWLIGDPPFIGSVESLPGKAATRSTGAGRPGDRVVQRPLHLARFERARHCRDERAIEPLPTPAGGCAPARCTDRVRDGMPGWQRARGIAAGHPLVRFQRWTPANRDAHPARAGGLPVASRSPRLDVVGGALWCESAGSWWRR